MESIEVHIEKDKINDLAYVQSKILNVCLQTLYELSNHTDKDFNNLAKEFLPVEEDKKSEIIKEFLSTIKTDIPKEKTDQLVKKKRKLKRMKKTKKKPIEQV